MPIPFPQQRVVEVTVRGNITAGGSNGRPTYNTYHFARATVLAPISKAAVDTAFQAAIGAKMLLALNVRWSQASNNVRCINDANDPFLTTAHINAGAVAGDGMPSMNVVYMLFRSTLRKGSYRGAKRFGPLSEADTTIAGEDVLNGAALVRFNALATAILAGFTDAGGDVWTPVVLSRKLSQVKNNPTNIVATSLAQILVNKRISRLKIRETASSY